MYSNIRRVLGVVLMLILMIFWVNVILEPMPGPEGVSDVQKLEAFYTTTPLQEIFAALIVTLWLIVATVYAYFLGWKGRQMRGAAVAIIAGQILWVAMILSLPRMSGGSGGSGESGAMSYLFALLLILGPPVVALLDLFLPERTQPYETP